MSAPSQAHEERVELLRAIAALSGYRCDIPINDDLVPDVARISSTTRGLFVGDAKATETSGCMATSERLQSYLRALRAHHHMDRPLLLVVAHGDLHDQPGWVATLCRALRRTGLGSPDMTGSLVIDDDDVLAYAIYGNDKRTTSGS
jgi:hypothetical protein